MYRPVDDRIDYLVPVLPFPKAISVPTCETGKIKSFAWGMCSNLQLSLGFPAICLGEKKDTGIG
jgi:hypothetical protein